MSEAPKFYAHADGMGKTKYEPPVIEATCEAQMEYLEYCIERGTEPTILFLANNKVRMILPPDGKVGETMAMHLYSKIPQYFKNRKSSHKVHYQFDERECTCVFTFTKTEL
jgi:hypothetical protein